MGSKVALWNHLSQYVVIDPKATVGAQVGVNLLAPDGSLVKWNDIVNVGAGTTTIDLSNFTTDDLDEGAFNLYFTVERAQDAVGASLTNSANVTLTYDDAGNTITADLTDVTVTTGGMLAKYGFDSKGRLLYTDAASTSDLPEGTNLYFTDDRAKDATGAAISAGTQTGITVTYNSGSHSIDFFVAPADFASKAPVSYAATAALPANTYNNGSSGVGATLTGNVNGPLLIDGVTMLTANLGERVLVAAEATTAHNGWYVITQIGVVAVSPYILTRSTDADTGAEIGPGYLTTVEAPSGLTPGSNNGKVFVSIAPVPFTVGTDTVTFSAVGSSGGVSSVFGRTGIVTAQAGDYTFAQIGSTPTTLAGYGITDAQPLQVLSLPATEALAANAMVSIWLNGSTWSVRNASAADDSKRADGFVKSAVSISATATVYLVGNIVSGLSGLVPGEVFLSESTAGGVTNTPPSATGQMVQCLGSASSASSFIFQPTPGILRG